MLSDYTCNSWDYFPPLILPFSIHLSPPCSFQHFNFFLYSCLSSLKSQKHVEGGFKKFIWKTDLQKWAL